MPQITFEIPESIRRTYIELYRTCPYKFLKEVIEGHRSPATCYTQIGIDLHDLFEEALHDRQLSKSKFFKKYNEFWDNYPDELFESEEQKETMWKRVEDSIDTFYLILPGMPMPFVTEEKIRLNIGDDIPDVEFTMDYISMNENGNLDMHDWKTGAVMVGKKLSSDLQAPLYIYGVQKRYNRQVDSFTFYYLKDNKSRVFTRIDDDRYMCTVGKREYYISLQDAIREVKSIFAQIVKGNFNIPRDTKSMFFACKMCHIKEQGMCQGADVQGWHNNQQGWNY